MPNRKEPLRRCVGCMEMKEKINLLRVVFSPNGEYIIDQTGKANGRGAYVCKNSECFIKAQKIKGLERSFKHKIPENIYKELHEVIIEFVK
ncbi:MAG: YlxR family protein [Defluviitaleaceae bacterium]|nr:YlxR family protein [Defluviitaleaceae bacterium]